MADSNQSNKPPMNTFGLSDIEKIGQTAYTIPKSEQEQRLRASTARQQLNLLQDIPLEVIASSRAMTRVQNSAPNTIRSAEGRIRSSVESRLERSNIQAMNAMGRQFSESAISVGIRDLSTQSGIQNSSFGMMGSSWEDLAAKKQSLINEIGSIGSQSEQLAKNTFSSRGMRQDVRSQLAFNTATANQKMREAASVHLAMESKRMAGEDPVSRFRDLNATYNTAQKSTGGTGDVAAAAQKLIAAMEALKTATDDTKDSMRKVAEQEAENFKKVSGSGGSGGRYDRMAAYGGAAGGALEFASQIGREVLLNQTNTITGNRITAAGLTNNLFDRRRAALSGDMTQLTMLTSGAMQGAQKEGGVNKRTSQGVDIASGIGGIVAGIGGLGAVLGGGAAGAAITGTAATLVGTAAAPIVAGAAAIGGAIWGASKLVNVVRGADSNAEKLAEEQRQISLASQMAHIPGAYRQRLYDYGQSTRGAALEIGGTAGAAFTNRFAGNSAGIELQRMEAARIGTEQFTQLAAVAGAQQGSVFNADQIYAARNLERTGMGTMQTNIGRMGALAGGGSNNPQASLQQVLEAAFTKSLDGAKTLNMIVENSAQMARSSAGATMAGLDTTGSYARIQAGLVNPNTQNKEMAVNRAATATGILNNLSTGTGFNWSDQVGMSMIERAGKVDYLTAKNLKSLDIGTTAALKKEAEDLGKMSKTDPNASKANAALSDKLTTMGLIDFTKNGQVDTSGLLKTISAKEAATRSVSLAGTGVTNMAGYSEYAGGASLESLKSKFPELYRAVTKGAVAITGATGAELATGGAATNISTDAKASATSKMTGTANINTAQKTLDDIATVQFVEMTKEASAAAKQLGGVADALGKINEASAALAGKLSDSTSGDVMKSGARAAESFEMGAETFTTGVTQFGNILNAFAKQIGVRVTSGDDKVQKR